MRTPPTDLTDDRLRAALDDGWGLATTELRYAPVGFGSHHWLATTPGGPRFVTVDDLGVVPAERPDRLHRLIVALTTARRLHDDAHLGAVVAPLPTAAGDVRLVVDGRFAVSVFPVVDGEPWPEAARPQDRAAVVRLLAGLHDATPVVHDTVGRDDLSLDNRDKLEKALQSLENPWNSGPYAEGARRLLADHAAEVVALLETYDDLARAAARHPAPWVVTHGEPKADNVLATAAGPVLVDWDTVLLAPAARDLWLVESGTGAELALYRELTGRDVPAGQLELFRLRWELTDVASYLGWFRRPHEHTADTEIGWAALEETLDLRRRWSHLLGGLR